LRRLFDAVPLVFARSKSLAERLKQLGCPPEKLRINRTGIPLKEFPFLEREPPRDGKWNVVQACRLIPKKGVATSLRAFAIFKKDYPAAKFFIAGKGPLQPELEMLAGGLGIARDVHFLGFLSQPKLRELYGSSHLFLHPSEISPNQDQEGVPNSVLEAMATGLPVVATRHGGIPEAVDHGRTGFLVAEEDHAALANAMQLIAGSPALLAEMGVCAHAAVKERFEQETQIDCLESFYEEAITMNGVAERVDARPVPRVAPQLAESLSAK
jgi:colanic acid/amylovoran biosynthesis glycosyltransferase